MDQTLTHFLMHTKQRAPVLRARIKDQLSFDELFALLFHHERTLVLRAADAVEKVSATNQEFLRTHKQDLLRLLSTSDHPELKMHLAQWIARITLLRDEVEEIWHILNYWTRNPNESKPVRVHALQSLYDLSLIFPDLQIRFQETVVAIQHERIPSLQARIKKIVPSLGVIS
jgi:hypothetical protein